MQTWKHTEPCHQISLFAQVHDLVCKETIVWREFLWHLTISKFTWVWRGFEPSRHFLFTSRTTCQFVRGVLGTRNLPLIIFPKHFSVIRVRFVTEVFTLKACHKATNLVRRRLEESLKNLDIQTYLIISSKSFKEVCYSFVEFGSCKTQWSRAK